MKILMIVIIILVIERVMITVLILTIVRAVRKSRGRRKIIIVIRITTRSMAKNH